MRDFWRAAASLGAGLGGRVPEKDTCCLYFCDYFDLVV